MLWDHRPGRTGSPASCCRSTRRRSEGSSASGTSIFTGTPLGFTEAPHLYKRDGYYYLITAEGGTGWGHAVTMARSRTLLGPYELHPDVYILTARHRPDVALQRRATPTSSRRQSGETYMVYLCGRPLRNRGRCTLGRETAIQPMTWGADGWLRTCDGEGIPDVEVAAPADAGAASASSARRSREDFDGAGRCRSTSNGCDPRGRTSCSA